MLNCLSIAVSPFGGGLRGRTRIIHNLLQSMFPIRSTQKISESELQSGVFLWITHADKIPPHIGISLDGNYFSLKVSGKDDTDTGVIYRTIWLRNIPAVFVRLDERAFSSERFLTVKNEYVSVNKEVTTCLVPILDMYGIKKKECLLADLLKYLEKKQQILAYFTLNLPADFEGIKTYSLEDVTAHLNKIKHAERGKHISESGRTV